MGIFRRDEYDSYRRAVEWLDRRYARFVTKVLSLGKPMHTSAIPTAAVAMDEGSLLFYANPEFVNGLDEQEYAFILAHETFHVLADHPVLFAGIPQSLQYPMVFNVAADAVINDWLDQYGIKVPEFKDFKPVRGVDVIGEDAANLTVMDVYRKLLSQVTENEDGTVTVRTPDGQEYTYTPLDVHEWTGPNPEPFNPGSDMGEPVDLADKIKADNGEERETTLTGWGNERSNMEAFTTNSGVSLKWAELLREIDPDMFASSRKNGTWGASFHRRRKKLAAFPDTILPVDRYEKRGGTREGEQPILVMALDVSGSIDQHDVDRFLQIAKSVPQDKVKVHACTFDTNYTPIDLNDPRCYAGGGTDFTAIVRFIDTLDLPRKPYVIAVTDTAADMEPWAAAQVDWDRWWWLSTVSKRGAYSFALSRGNFRLLKEFIA